MGREAQLSIQWEPHGHARISHGLVGGEQVAVIVKHKNHTYTNSGIYSVHVLGAELRDRFRGIKEARDAGDAEYERKRPG